MSFCPSSYSVEDDVDDLKRSSMVSEEKVSGLKAAASASIRSGVVVRSSGAVAASAAASRERNRKGKRRITEEIDEEEDTLNTFGFIKFHSLGSANVCGQTCTIQRLKLSCFGELPDVVLPKIS